MADLVFVSYNRADKEAAREVAIFLAAENQNVWFDEWEIQAGDSIVQHINTGLQGCTHFCIIWSRNASTSNWVRRELYSILARAIESGSPKVIPLRLDDTPLPELLADIRYIRFHGGTEEDRQEIIRAVTGRSPSRDFVKAIVKKYHELIRDESASAQDPFGLKACPECGSQRLKGSTQIYEAGDEAYYLLACEECGWSDWRQ